MISIQPESSDDHNAIRLVTIDAFAGSDLGHNGEADLIDILRENCEHFLSLVAFDQGQLVGHILFTPAVIRSAGKNLYGMGLAPLSVLTSHQRMGVGSALLAAGLERLASSNTPFTVVAGHADYYSRFGFVPAGSLGLTHGFAGMPQELFFVYSDAPDALRSLGGGSVRYRPEFGPQHIGRAATNR